MWVQVRGTFSWPARTTSPDPGHHTRAGRDRLSANDPIRRDGELPWFLVDDDFPTDPRVLATSLAARGLWVTAGAWASKRLTDVVPAHVVAALGGTPEQAAELVVRGVWNRVRGAYQFTHEGLCKTPVKEAVEHSRKLKADRQSRWREGQRRRDVDASTGRLHERRPGSVTSTNKEPPNPPQAGGHDGSHANCRACGTNQRGPAPPAPPTPTPPPLAEVLAANGSRRVASEDVADLLAGTRRAITAKRD